MIFRVFFFIGLVFVSVTLPTWVFVLCAVIYALRYTAYELMFLGLCIDVYYGAGPLTHLAYYTIGAAVLIFIAEYMKPRLWVYNDRT